MTGDKLQRVWPHDYLIKPRRRALIVAHVIASYVAVLIDITFNVASRGASPWSYVTWPLSPIILPIGVLVVSIRGGIDATWLPIASYLPARAIAYWTLSRRYQQHLRQQRLATRLCPSCGYDLRATPNSCPECGYQRA